MTRWKLRTTLTLSYAAVLALLLGALGVAYYHVFARQLDADATAELREMTRAVHGYLRFEGGTPEQLHELTPTANSDARLLVDRDGGLQGPRGRAAQILLYLMERDAAVALLRSG